MPLRGYHLGGVKSFGVTNSRAVLKSIKNLSNCNLSSPLPPYLEIKLYGDLHYIIIQFEGYFYFKSDYQMFSKLKPLHYIIIQFEGYFYFKSDYQMFSKLKPF